MPLAPGGPKFNALLVNQELLLNLDAAYVRSQKVGMLLCRSELCARICDRLFPSVPLAVPSPAVVPSPRSSSSALSSATAAVVTTKTTAQNPKKSARDTRPVGPEG